MPEFSPWLLWFLAGVVIMLAELFLPGFVIIFFGLGCWFASLVAAFAPEAQTAQLVVFLVVSVASLLALRKMAMRIFVGRSDSTETVDSGNNPLGSRITLEIDLEPGRTGRVRFRGTMWDAISEERLAAGSEAEVIGLDKSKGACLRLKSPTRA